MWNPYASIRRRALATLIDGIPLGIVGVVIVLTVGDTDQVISRTDEQTSAFWFAELGPTTIMMLLLFTAFYYIGMELTFGGTLGKLMTGLRVRNGDGSPLSFKGALLRFCFRFVDGFFWYIPAAVTVSCTSKNQRIGDLVGGTVVCYREALIPRPTLTYSESGGWQSY